MAQRLFQTDAWQVSSTGRRAGFSSNVIAILAGQAAGGVIALLTEVCYARLLGPEARGIISVCLMCMAFGVLIGAAGGEGSIVFWSARERGGHVTWLPAVLLWGLLGSVVALGLWRLAYWHYSLPFLRGISPTSAWLVLANIPAAILFAYAMALLAGIERFSLRSIGAVLRQLATIGALLVVCLFTARSAATALFGTLTGYLASAAVIFFLLRKELRGFWRVRSAAANLMPTLSYGLRGQIGNLATFFTYRLDVFVINYFLPLAQLGFYALGVTVSEALWQVPSAAAYALFPRTSRMEGETTRFSCLVVRQVFLLTVVCGLLLALTCPFAVPLIFGARFTASVPVILWLLPGTIALSLAKVGCSDLAGRGKNGYSSIFAVVCLGLTVAFDFLLIPRWGIQGAAAASSLAYFIDSVLVLLALRFELHATWRDLLVPAAEDFDFYRAAWRRLSAARVGRRSGSVSARSEFSSVGSR